MSFIDFLISEYSFIFSVLSTIAGMLLTIWGRKRDDKWLEKAGKALVIAFSVLGIIMLLGRYTIVVPHGDGNETESKLDTENKTLEDESEDILGTENELSEFGDGSSVSKGENAGDVLPKEEVLQVEELQQLSFECLSITPLENTIASKEVQYINSSIESVGQYNDHIYVPALDGTYRLEFANVPEGTDFKLTVYNSALEMIHSKQVLDSGDGITISLQEGKKYIIRVAQYNNLGTYILNIGQQNEISDISAFTKIYHEIHYKDQVNKYMFSPTYSGLHRFQFSDVPNGTDLMLSVYNSGWELIDEKKDLDNDDGISVSLSANEFYYICVEHYNGIGRYALNVGNKKTINDITGYSKVVDSIQYKDQQNDYKYIPEIGGGYRFGFANVPEGTDLKLSIYNSGMELIYSKADMDSGDGINCILKAGDIYFIRVEEYNENGAYTLEIGAKKEVVNISMHESVLDSIQYKKQQNDYFYIPLETGSYEFYFSDVPEGTDLKLFIYNSGWELICSKTNMDNRGKLKVDLEAHTEYYVRVEQYVGVGKYKLLRKKV